MTREESGRKVPFERIQKMLQTKTKNGTLTPKRRHGSWVQQWEEIGGQKFYSRSRWETIYAQRLELLKKAGEVVKWEHEPETFWFNVRKGTTNYTPDFKVEFSDGRIEFHEIKGWMDAKSATKIKRMRIYHPSVVLKVFDSKWFKANRLLPRKRR